MRSKLSIFSLAGLIGAFFAFPISAHEGPNIEFGYGPRLPTGCTAVEADTASWGGVAFDLECTASVSDDLDFSIIIQIPSSGSLAGMGGYSFGAQWDTNLQNALTVNSATQGTQAYIEVAPGPPPVTVGYNVLQGPGAPVGPGGLTQSTESAAGEATNWEAIGASPDSSVNLESAGASFRAGRINVTVDSETGTSINLGWYNSLQDAYVAGSADTATEEQMFFGIATINAPEPASSLALLAGIASVALLARRGRQNR